MAEAAKKGTRKEETGDEGRAPNLYCVSLVGGKVVTRTYPHDTKGRYTDTEHTGRYFTVFSGDRSVPLGGAVMSQGGTAGGTVGQINEWSRQEDEITFFTFAETKAKVAQREARALVDKNKRKKGKKPTKKAVKTA